MGAYSVFPNDGILIKPHVIRRVVQADGLPLKEVTPVVKQVIEVDTARTMMKLLSAVTTYGTGAQAGAVLKHPLGGKTGTTNSYTDAWFIGFSPSVTCGTWIGFDDRKSLGEKETGAKAALPMWIDFMKAVVARTPVESFPTAVVPNRALDVDTDEATPPPAKRPADDDDDPDDSAAPAKPAVPAVPPPSSAPGDTDVMPNDTPSTATPRTSTPASAPPPNGYVNSPTGPYRPYTAPAPTPAAPRTTPAPTPPR